MLLMYNTKQFLANTHVLIDEYSSNQHKHKKKHKMTKPPSTSRRMFYLMLQIENVMFPSIDWIGWEIEFQYVLRVCR